MLRTELVLAIVSLALAGASGSHVILNGTSIGSAESPSQDQGVDIPDLWDSNSWSFFLLLQLFPAQLSDIFPGSPWVFLSPDTSFYRLKVCERAAVTDCMPAGVPPSFPSPSHGHNKHWQWLCVCLLDYRCAPLRFSCR